MNAPYDHPPRSLGYYLGYLLILLICLAPSLVIIPIWTLGLDFPPMAVLGLMAVVALLQLLIIAYPLLGAHTVVTDVGLPKDNDISYQMLPYPKRLNEAAMLLEMEGFERFGEIETSTVASKMPHPQWLYRSPKGHIVVGMLEIGEGASAQVLVGFSTYGKKGVVTTTYPKGHRVRTGQSRFNGVNSSISGAYEFHRQEVKTWMEAGNRPIAISTIQEYIDLDCQSGAANRVWVRQNLIDAVLGFLLLFFALTPSFMLVAVTFLPKVFTGVMSNERLYIGVIILGLGLLLGSLVGQRGKGQNIKSAKAKNKLKAKRKTA